MSGIDPRPFVSPGRLALQLAHHRTDRHGQQDGIGEAELRADPTADDVEHVRLLGHLDVRHLRDDEDAPAEHGGVERGREELGEGLAERVVRGHQHDGGVGLAGEHPSRDLGVPPTSALVPGVSMTTSPPASTAAGCSTVTAATRGATRSSEVSRASIPATSDGSDQIPGSLRSVATRSGEPPVPGNGYSTALPRRVQRSRSCGPWRRRVTACVVGHGRDVSSGSRSNALTSVVFPLLNSPMIAR